MGKDREQDAERGDKACDKKGRDLQPENIDRAFSGDLLNQCIGAGFGMRDSEIPFYGIYGACSTMIEGVSLAAMSIDGGYANAAAAVTSSHFCTAERQYRTPLPYGGQRTPTAQWTVTGAASAVLKRGAAVGDIAVTSLTAGKIVDKGVKDANNMGGAMAPAARMIRFRRILKKRGCRRVIMI